MVRVPYFLICLMASVAIGLVSPSARAQSNALAIDLATQDDRGFIVGLLENALGGEGRIVRVDGFAGALSQTATIQQMTISDKVGVWFKLEGVQLRWTRSALLRGRIEIEELSAATLTLNRQPIAPDDALPSAEADGFALPNLPVSVSIDLLKVDRIALGRAILGEDAEMSLNATAQLASGSGSIELNAQRTDGKQGRFVIDASYVADTKMAAIKIDLNEAKGGIAARILNLPERPDLALKVEGKGNIDNLVTDLSLATSGIPRLSGQVVLQGSSDEGRNFNLNLVGDLTSLLAQEYHAFFGDRSTLRAQGKQTPNGALELSDLDLQTDALFLKGFAALNTEYAPLRLALTGRIKPKTDGTVVLPIGDGQTSIVQAGLEVEYDAAINDTITVALTIDGLNTPDIAVRSTQLNVQGTLDSALNPSDKIQADVIFQADGAKFEDASLQQALGRQINGSMQLIYRTAGQLRLKNMKVEGQNYGLDGEILVKGLSEALESDIDIALRARRLAQFSSLANMDLTGQAELAIKGTAALGGTFNLQFDGSTTDLGIGIEQADKALAGVTKLTLAVIRDETGTQIPLLEIQNAQVQANANATLKTNGTKAQFDIKLVNSAQIDPRLNGPVSFAGTAEQDANGWIVDTKMIGPFAATTTLAGRATGANSSLRFDFQIPDIQPLAGQFRGPAKLSGTASQRGEVWKVETDLNGPYGISGALAGAVTGPAPRVSYQLRVPNVASLGAQIDGALAIDGTAAQLGTTWRIDTTIDGLNGTRAQISGSVFEGGRVDIRANGTAPLALANPFLTPRNIQGGASFDLAMKGTPDLSALSGTISTTGARLSAPNLRISLTDIAAQIGLQRGRAQIDATAGVSSGGQVALRGPVILNNSLAADLSLALSDVRLVDPSLYETSLGGQITLRGPLSGGARIAGQINVGETNVRVPESKVVGFTIVPTIVHRNASSGVRQTISRAGIDARASETASSTGGGVAYPLDIRVNAPARIFVRGRGLDAELGGALQLRGTTNDIISTGRFELIRGRVDILTKRFVLDEGSIALQGKLDPYMRFVATTRTSTGTASIIIEGLASNPNVSFSSAPEAPQDEVLAQIFFGKDVSKLSAFQALQLASAVATLAGSGGEGIVSKLRRGFGLDDLDITTDEQGNAGIKFGKYITDNVYTDVTVGAGDTSAVSINIDLTPSITARGQVKSNGNSSVGIYFEKDY